METITLRIPDMHCTNCAMRLEGIEDDLPGVQRVDASYARMQMAVAFDPQRVSLAEIIAAVERLGYHAVKLE